MVGSGKDPDNSGDLRFLFDDNVMFDRKSNQFGGILDAELRHHPVFMKLHRPGGEIQCGRNIFDLHSLCEKLQDFTLTRREFARIVSLLNAAIFVELHQVAAISGLMYCFP